MNAQLISRVIYALIVLAAFGVYLYKGNGDLFFQIVLISSIALLLILQQITLKKLEKCLETKSN